MAWNSDSLGGIEDDVAVTIDDGSTTRVLESYEVRHSFFTQQPNVFACRFGSGETAVEILKRMRPRARIELRVGGALQQTGWIDGPEIESDAQAGTTITIHGRDAMADLHDAQVPADRSWKDVSFEQLTSDVLLAALGTTGFTLFTHGNEANRKTVTGGGAQVPAIDAPPDIKPALIGTSSQGKQLHAKAGEHWYAFLKKELDRAGLFLICGASGEFILCRPNGQQRPLYRILREPNATRQTTSATRVHFKNLTHKRHTVYEVLGKGGGKGGVGAGVGVPEDAPEDIKPALIAAMAASSARRPLRATFVDEEMVALGYPLSRVRTFRDNHVTSIKQCEFLARLRCAQARRENWELVYTLAGHTTPGLRGGQRLTWAVDTMVEVIDKELGIEGTFWVETVLFRRAATGGTTTEIHLMRPQDLVFGEVP